MATPTSYDLTVKQGANHSFTVTYLAADGQPVDLTGWTARMQIRRHAWAEVLVEVTTVYSSDGLISIDTDTGEVTVLLEAAATAKLSGTYAYDLFVYEPSPGNDADALVQGAVHATAQVTR